VTTRPRERVDERFCLMMRTADRLRQRAWRGYLDATRDQESYELSEPAAWARLQSRLAAIDDELFQALTAETNMESTI
jgi:hypothetical protein